jgi:predicted transcriptional regulator
MSLKILNINFTNREDFLYEIRGALFEGKEIENTKEDEISFDNVETFKRVISQNKLQILMAISRLKPESIYQLEKFVNRKYPHVLKDCRQLESLGFIKLIESEGAKKQLHPKLIFDYDLIRVKSEIEEVFAISEVSNQVLLESNVG